MPSSSRGLFVPSRNFLSFFFSRPPGAVESLSIHFDQLLEALIRSLYLIAVALFTLFNQPPSYVRRAPGSSRAAKEDREAGFHDVGIRYLVHSIRSCNQHRGWPGWIQRSETAVSLPGGQNFYVVLIRVRIRDAPISNGSFPAAATLAATSNVDPAVAAPASASELSSVRGPIEASGYDADNTAIIPMSPLVSSETRAAITFSDLGGRPFGTENPTTLAVTTFVTEGTASSLGTAQTTGSAESAAAGSSITSPASGKQQGSAPAVGNGPASPPLTISTSAAAPSVDTGSSSAVSSAAGSSTSSEASGKQQGAAPAVGNSPNSPPLTIQPSTTPSTTPPTTEAASSSSSTSSAAESVTTAASAKQQGAAPALGNGPDPAAITVSPSPKGDSSVQQGVPAQTSSDQAAQPLATSDASSQAADPSSEVGSSAVGASAGSGTGLGVTQTAAVPGANATAASPVSTSASLAQSQSTQTVGDSYQSSVTSAGVVGSSEVPSRPDGSLGASASGGNATSNGQPFPPSQASQLASSTDQAAPSSATVLAPSQSFVIFADSAGTPAPSPVSSASQQPPQLASTSSSLVQGPSATTGLANPGQASSTVASSVRPTSSNAQAQSQSASSSRSAVAASNAGSAPSLASSPTSKPTPASQGPNQQAGNPGLAPSSSVFAAPAPSNAVPDVTITFPNALPLVPASAGTAAASSSTLTPPAPAASGADAPSLPEIVSASAAPPQPSPYLSGPSNGQTPSSVPEEDTPAAPPSSTATFVVVSPTRTSEDEAPGITIIPINDNSAANQVPGGYERQRQDQRQVLALDGGDIPGADTVLVREKTVTVTATTTATTTAIVTSTVFATLVPSA